jgi:hypothetical protein
LSEYGLGEPDGKSIANGNGGIFEDFGMSWAELYVNGRRCEQLQLEYGRNDGYGGYLIDAGGECKLHGRGDRRKRMSQYGGNNHKGKQLHWH